MVKVQNKSDKTLKLCTVIVFIIFLITGLLIYDDYGVTLDEPYERRTGLVNLKFILKDLMNKPLPDELSALPALESYEDQDYGFVLQFPTILFEYFTNFKHDISSIYKFRHLWTFLNFYISVIFFNLLLYQRFRNRLISLLGTLFLIISPRIFADSFYNTKDLLFLSWFTIGLFFLYQFFHRTTKQNSLVLAIVIALAANTRIIGYILLITAGFYLLYLLLKKKIDWKQFFTNGLILVVVNILLWFLFFPASWGKPIDFLIQSIHHFTNNISGSQELYLGRFEPSMDLPWHYLPVWIFISTPLFYTVLFFIGVIFLIRDFRIKDPDQVFDYIILGIFIISFLMPICLHSTLYNGWRHFYFLYVLFLYVVIFAISIFLENKNKVIQTVTLGLSIGILIFNGAWMIKNHPYQMVYFNVLVRDKAPYHFEKDYWRASSSECLRFIASQSEDLRIEVGDYDAELYSAKFALNKVDRDRIVEEPFGYDAWHMKYVVLNYTKVIGNEKEIPFYEPVYKVQVDGMNIAAVFERKDRDGIWANAIVKDVKSNINTELTPRIFDQDDQTGWSTERFQQKGDYLLFELKDTMKLNGISILSGTGKYEYPQDLQIEGSENGIDWEILPLTYQTQSDYAFSPAEVRYIKLMLDQDSDENAWAVNNVMFHVVLNQ